MAARRIQYARGGLNAHLSTSELETACALGDDERAWLSGVLARLNLSARAYHRVLKVARTIADLNGEETVEKGALMEAIGYRQLDRMMGRGV